MVDIKSFKMYMKNNKYNVLIWTVISISFFLYLSLIFNINVTTDEIYSMNLFKSGIKGILDQTSVDVHPPLYYFYGYIFELISSQNIHLQKAAAIIPMVGTLVIVATLLRKEIGDKATFFSILFFSCVPCTMEYAIQLRMYSLACFFTTLCGIEAYLAYKYNKKANWVIFCIAAIGAEYTVYFALVAVCFEIGLLFLSILLNKDRIKSLLIRFLICISVIVIVYLPWIPYFIAQTTRVRGDYYLPPITKDVIWGYFTWTFDLETIPGFVYIFIMLLTFACGIALVALLKKHDLDIKEKGIISISAMLIPTLTTLAGVIISMSKSPIYEGRYVIIEMMMLALFFGTSIGYLVPAIIKNTHIKNGIFVFATLILMISGAFQYYECFKQEYVGKLTEETIAFFDEHLGPNDYILYNYEAMGFDYKFYFPNDRLYYVRDFDFENTEYENLWFLSNLYEWPITDADCYTYWISYEFMGTYGVEDNKFDLYRYYHNDFPKIEIQ